ncbi:PaaI family thioesterase [Kitasatospora saccharophila]|uniref:PaaI family thioesterase n=1 Tax=Kitasatospora saccharophila TaxID=407973 RepID=A0ABP5JW06_9ACTN
MADRPILTAAEVQALLTEYFPDWKGLRVAEVTATGLVCTADPEALPTRPGGTVSGPALFAIADVSAYLAVSAFLGATPAAVLTSSSASFLEAVEPAPLRVRIEAVRLGRRTGVFSATVEDLGGAPVVVATLHFAFPGRRARG